MLPNPPVQVKCPTPCVERGKQFAAKLRHFLFKLPGRIKLRGRFPLALGRPPDHAKIRS